MTDDPVVAEAAHLKGTPYELMYVRRPTQYNVRYVFQHHVALSANEARREIVWATIQLNEGKAEWSDGTPYSGKYELVTIGGSEVRHIPGLEAAPPDLIPTTGALWDEWTEKPACSQLTKTQKEVKVVAKGISLQEAVRAGQEVRLCVRCGSAAKRRIALDRMNKEMGFEE